MEVVNLEKESKFATRAKVEIMVVRLHAPRMKSEVVPVAFYIVKIIDKTILNKFR